MVATGKENARIMCNPETTFMEGDTFQWYFTRTTIQMMQFICNESKYSISGSVSQTLTVRNISLGNKGFYYCQIVRNGVLLSEITPGACVFAYGKLSCIMQHRYRFVCVCVCT